MFQFVATDRMEGGQGRLVRAKHRHAPVRAGNELLQPRDQVCLVAALLDIKPLHFVRGLMLNGWDDPRRWHPREPGDPCFVSQHFNDHRHFS